MRAVSQTNVALNRCQRFARGSCSLTHACRPAVQSELELMLRGQGEEWSRDFLLATIKCDHGYTAASSPVRHFVEVLAEMSSAEQRLFLKFVTGSPRLPPGGLAALRPHVTLVMKHNSSNRTRLRAPSVHAIELQCARLPQRSCSLWCCGVSSVPHAASVGRPEAPLRFADRASHRAHWRAGDGRDDLAGHDQELPSVMTCANYIKLPPYSSKAACARQLRLAVQEGQGSFDLS
jgi:E3 ubiquitin-protein ligase TRIP12